MATIKAQLSTEDVDGVPYTDLPHVDQAALLKKRLKTYSSMVRVPNGGGGAAAAGGSGLGCHPGIAACDDLRVPLVTRLSTVIVHPASTPNIATITTLATSLLVRLHFASRRYRCTSA